MHEKKSYDTLHTWHFNRVGGAYRVNLASGEDLRAIDRLDKKLWSVLSCPVDELKIDNETLRYMDTNQDGRIRTPEVVEAVRWITTLIKNPDDLLKRSPDLPLSAIDEHNPEGRTLLDSARKILNNIGKEEAVSISAADTSDTTRIFADTRFNGDGVITGYSADDDQLAALIRLIMECIGSVPDRSGQPGINRSITQLFFQQCSDFSRWQEQALSDPGRTFPLGEQTGEAYGAIEDVKEKIDDFFFRVRFATYDSESAARLCDLSDLYEEIKKRGLNTSRDEILDLPLVKMSAGEELPLEEGLNPLWEKRIKNFQEKSVLPVLGSRKALSRLEWLSLNDYFSGYAKWQADKPQVQVEKLGNEKIDKILAGEYQALILKLIDRDNTFSEAAENIEKVDKLVRYYRDIFTVLNNFVTFHDFYSTDRMAAFQAGRLYIDRRCCELCIRVNDYSRHLNMATRSGICLVYCECRSKNQKETFTIAAALTNGDSSNIFVGRNGVFIDEKGLDWDATVIKVVEHPISVRESFWSPYRRFGRFISEQVERFASSREQSLDSRASESISRSAQQADAGLRRAAGPDVTAPAPGTPTATSVGFDIARFVGIFAAIGLALGALGSVMLAVVSGFLSLEWWKMPLAMLGVVLVISGPSMILAMLKLRKRNLAPILDANGWAVNARVTVNIWFGRTLTRMASVPAGSKLNRKDPFRSNRRYGLWSLLFVLLGAAVLLFLHYFGRL